MNPQLNQFNESKPLKNQAKLNSQILRIKVHQHAKHGQACWKLKEKQLCQFFNNYIPLSRSQINMKSLFKSKQTRLIKSQNKIYFGGVVNKKKEGKGILIYKQGKIFQGEFQNNEKHGFGCEIYPNGNIYIGKFLQNKKHGIGQFYWFNLCDKDSQKETNQNLQRYIGTWWGGLPDGQGVHFKLNGDMYEGQFKNGLKHGKGVQKFHNKDEYRGQYVNGLPEGYGQYFWSNGSQYQGDFKQGFRNGYGIWKKNNNSYQNYAGYYVLDQKNGYGVYDWGNGYCYKGNYQKDVRNGYGQLYFNQDLVYKGNWENGQTDENLNPDQIKKKKTLSSISKKQFQRTPIKQMPIKLSRTHLSQISKEKYHAKRQFSAGNRSIKNQTNSFYISFKHTNESTSGCKNKYDHKKCISYREDDKKKNTRKQWQNPRVNWEGPLSSSKNKLRYHY